MEKEKYYAVKIGRVPGIYTTWADCKAQIDKFPNALFKSFESSDEAVAFMSGKDISNPDMDLTIKDNEAIAFTDGSYINGHYGGGVVIISKDKDRYFVTKGSDEEAAEMKNIAGEILAVEKAVNFAVTKGYKKITIYCDYIGLIMWANGKWRATKKKTIQYSNFINRMKKQIEIELFHTKAHSGNKYNELADKLAKKAVTDED